MSYQSQLKTIDEDVLGENDWLWVKEDTSAWLGPMLEYVRDHQYKFYQYLKGNKVVISAGANCGLHIRFFAKKFERVYAFEPDPLNFHCMVNNAQYDNVIKMMCALGEENKLIKIARAELAHCGSHRIDQWSEERVVPMLTIDTLGLDACDFIQLDVEGYEAKVLEGAKKTIMNYCPVISVETVQGNDYPEVLMLMHNFGYKKVDFSGSDSIWVKL